MHPGRVAHDDQRRAAQAETVRVFGHIERTLAQSTRLFMPAADVPVWLRDMLVRHVDALGGQLVRGCPHVRSGAPVACALAAWAPGVLVCLECFGNGAASEARGSDAEFTCDRPGCGRVCREGGLQVATIQIGPNVLFLIGLCWECRLSKGKS